MDETYFEHTIFPNIDDYLEHCRKQLQGAASSLFQELDRKLNGLIVTFAFDTAKQSDKEFVAAPTESWVLNTFEPHIETLPTLIKAIDQKVMNKKRGTVFYVTPAIIQPFIRRVHEQALKAGISVFYSEAILAGSFVVFASLWFRTTEYDRYFKLAPRENQVRSLVDSVTRQFLRDAHVFMLHKLAPDGLLQAFPTSTHYLLRKAGEGLLARISLYLPKENIRGELETITRSSTLFNDLNTISKMRYEGAEAYGNLLICAPNHSNIELLMKFTSPIWSHEHRQVRKLLEIAHDGIYLLCDKGDIYGFGRKNDDYVLNSETLFDIEIIGHAAWRLKHGEEVLMVVQYDQPSLHVERKTIYLQRMEKALTAEFTSLAPDKIQNLQSLVEMAMEQQHGTMLVISDHAKEEASRLEKQSVHITPTFVDNELMKLITAIDGAVLLDVEGQCYAIGVILDGIVEPGEGDPSRGARYHAALKYLSYARQRQHKSLIVVVSEDGMINIFPEKA